MQKGMDRRDFLKVTGGAIAASMVAGPGMVFGQTSPGAKVNSMKLMTATAAFDPVRPEVARICAQAFKSLGWDVEPDPIEYQQNVQRVIMEHNYDMWFVMLSGAPIRIDPDVFLYQCNDSHEYKKGGYNWEGLNNPKIDKIVEAQRREMNVEKRRDIVFKAQEMVQHAQSMSVLAYPQMTQAYRSDRIKNLTPMMGSGIGSFWTDLSMEVVQGNPYVRSGMSSALKNWNPIAVDDYLEFMEVRMVYDRLFRIDPHGKAVPWMVKSYNLPDPRTIDLTIRDGMLWHDGKPVTIDDVKFSFDYQTKWKAPFFYSQLTKIESVTITNKNSLRIKLKEPFAPFISNLLGGMFIIPKHIWQDIPEKVHLDDPLNYPNEKPIGSGPFKLDYWERGREYKATAFKKHFHPPKCGGIIGIVYGSQDAMASAIQMGDCDRTRYILQPSLMRNLQKVKNVVGKGYPSHGFYTLTYNTRRPPLSDPVFRRALDHVIPKDMIINSILLGLADKGGSVIAPANEFWHNPAVKPRSTDIHKAKGLLAEAGYTWDNQGKLHYPKKA